MYAILSSTWPNIPTVVTIFINDYQNKKKYGNEVYLLRVRLHLSSQRPNFFQVSTFPHEPIVPPRKYIAQRYLTENVCIFCTSP